MIQGDVSTDSGRVALFNYVSEHHKDLNIVFHNAAVGEFTSIDDPRFWEKSKQETETNVMGPIHLTHLFLPHLKSKPNSLIATVTSMAAFVPIKEFSNYGATKAAIHYFTQALRYAVRGTSVAVAEIIPGPVITDMLPAAMSSIITVTSESYAAYVIAQLEAGHTEITTPLDGLKSRYSFEDVSRLEY